MVKWTVAIESTEFIATIIRPEQQFITIAFDLVINSLFIIATTFINNVIVIFVKSIKSVIVVVVIVNRVLGAKAFNNSAFLAQS